MDRCTHQRQHVPRTNGDLMPCPVRGCPEGTQAATLHIIGRQSPGAATYSPDRPVDMTIPLERWERWSVPLEVGIPGDMRRVHVWLWKRSDAERVEAAHREFQKSR